MKRKFKWFFLGFLACVLLVSLSVSTLAASGMTISIEPIKVMVNGAEFKPKDVNGKDALVFAYGGTTYAPLRALAEAYGLTVGYDAAAKMATVEKPMPSSLTLGIGTYTVGEDIAPGKYDVVALSGLGNFQGDVAACQFGLLNEILGAPDTSSILDHAASYSNLVLASGDIFHIMGNLELQFTKK